MSKKEFILNYLECSYNEIENNPKLAYKISRQHMITKLDIPQRTLDRNISALIKENKIEEKLVNGKKYYTYIQKSKSKEFLLTKEECEALEIAGEFLSAYKNTPLEEHFNSALKKIKQSSVEFKIKNKQDYNKFFIDHIPHVAFFNKESFKKISEAIDLQNEITLEYFTFNRREGNRMTPKIHKVEPYQFVYKDMRWYLLAYNIETKYFSLYALSRVKELYSTSKKFKKRKKALNDFIRLKQKTVKAEVVSEVSSQILPYIYEMNLFKNGRPFLKDKWRNSLNEKIAFQDGKYYTNLPNNIKYKINFNEYEWETLAYKYSFRKWALGWGKEVTVSSPEEYVQDIYKEILHMKSNYEKRLKEINENREEYKLLEDEFKNDPEVLMFKVCGCLGVSNNDETQCVVEDLVRLFGSKRFDPSKGSVYDFLRYLIRLRKLKAPIVDLYGQG